MLSYNSKEIEDYCEQIGLQFSPEDFKQFALRAAQEKLTQKQVDFALREHAWRIRVLFNPKSYSYWNRVKLAVYFLNPFTKGL